MVDIHLVGWMGPFMHAPLLPISTREYRMVDDIRFKHIQDDNGAVKKQNFMLGLVNIQILILSLHSNVNVGKNR